MKTEGKATRFLLFSSVWSLLMEHNKRVLNELLKRVFAMIYCMIVSLICICKLRNMIQITSDCPTGFHWVSKSIHVMWYTFMVWLL